MANPIDPNTMKQDPQMQIDFDKWVAKGWKIIHSEPTRTSIIEAVKNAPNPVEGVANTAVMVVNKLDEVSRRAGTEVHDSIKLQALPVFVDDIVKISKVDMQPREVNASVTLAIQIYVKGEIDAGRMDSDELQRQVMQLTDEMSPEDKQMADNSMKETDEVGKELYPEEQQSMLGGQV